MCAMTWKGWKSLSERAQGVNERRPGARTGWQELLWIRVVVVKRGLTGRDSQVHGQAYHLLWNGKGQRHQEPGPGFLFPWVNGVPLTGFSHSHWDLNVSVKDCLSRPGLHWPYSFHWHPKATLLSFWDGVIPFYPHCYHEQLSYFQ